MGWILFMMCLMGNTMRKGVDFSESFSIGARMASIRLVFAICAAYGLHDKMIDVKAAYLNAVKPASGPGSETYVYQPPGFEEYGPNGEILATSFKRSPPKKRSHRGYPPRSLRSQT